LEKDILARSAHSGFEEVAGVVVVNGDLTFVSLLEGAAARHALCLHADDFWLGVDMVDERKQHEAAEEGEQHEAAD
jgi:hypothetical protein